jgi:hypothetical protein
MLTQDKARNQFLNRLDSFPWSISDKKLPDVRITLGRETRIVRRVETDPEWLVDSFTRWSYGTEVYGATKIAQSKRAAIEFAKREILGDTLVKAMHYYPNWTEYKS